MNYERLRKLAQKAPPGPWEADVATYDTDCGEFLGGYIPNVAEMISADHYSGDVPPLTKEDAEFIAAANPVVVLGLLDTLDRYKTGNERLQNLIVDLGGKLATRAGGDD